MNDKEHRNLERAGKADTDRILTIPNVLSFFRLALIPVIIVLYAKNEVWWAFGMLVLSGVTDVVDGWVARTYHMVSNFGKAIDPVADKPRFVCVSPAPSSSSRSCALLCVSSMPFLPVFSAP